MSNLTQRGPNANAPAKLPSLQAARAQDPNVQKALEALREWVEVRLGSRGDRFERAVTFRDLVSELDALKKELATAASEASSTTTRTDSSTKAELLELQTALIALRNEFELLSNTLLGQIAAALAALEDVGDFSTNTDVSVENELVLFADTTGKLGKRSTGTGFVKLTSGVSSVDTDVFLTTGVTTSVVDEVVLFANTTGKLGKRATGTGYAKLTSGVLSADSTTTVRTDLQGDGAAVDQIGFRGIPLTSRSADYTLGMADAGKGTLHPAADANARTFTIPANASVAFPVGTAHTFVNETSQVVTIAITTDTLTLAGTTTSGSRSLAQNGVATALKVTPTKWVISGAGLT